MENEKKEFEKSCPGYPYLSTILEKRKRIIVIGDLHGDYEIMIKCLKLSNVINNDDEWIGKDTVVVQIGDQIDRCRPIPSKNIYCHMKHATANDENSDVKILEYMTNLHSKAVIHNGGVYSLLGNHEMMNVSGFMEYVSYEGLVNFDENLNLEKGIKNRKKLFSPGNKIANYLACTRLSSIIIGSFIFVHAGIVPEFLHKENITTKEDLYILNKKVRLWLLGVLQNKHMENINENAESLFWTRKYGKIKPGSHDEYCKDLNKVLTLFKLGHMVVGHTPQFIENISGINSTCNNKLMRVDVGQSQAFDNVQKISDSITESAGESYVNLTKKNYSQHRKKFVADMRKAQVLEILNDETMRVLIEK